MPIYEYRCRGCGNDFEKYVPGASTKVTCPTCSASDVTRKLSVFGLGVGTNPSPVASGMSGGGGCCGGGGCGCH